MLSNSQHTHATLATRTAIHASVFTVIVADAQAKHTTRMLYPWSTLTDGGLLLFMRMLASQARTGLFRTLFNNNRICSEEEYSSVIDGISLPELYPGHLGQSAYKEKGNSASE